MSHYIIVGAGAVGGNMGALLARSGQRVTLVCRPAVVAAVRRQGGLLHIQAGEARLVPLEAVPHPADVRPDGKPVLFFTAKAGDLASGLEASRPLLAPDTLAVTWQNGIRAEDQALPIFPNLLGGIVRATSTMLTPGEVRIRVPGLLIAGRYPPAPGTADPDLNEVIGDLRTAGFDAHPSPDIRADKGLKLLLNLISGASPLIRFTGEPAPNLSLLERSVLIEGARVLRAAGVPAWPASGQGDDVPTMLRHLAAREPRAPATDGVHNSTWQNLALPGRRLENDYMNGEIVALAARVGMAAPWNGRLLDLLNEFKKAGLGPGSLSDAELGRRISDLPPPDPWQETER